MRDLNSFIDNMFKTLPKTKEIDSIKTEILGNMQDKVEQLESEGSSHEEAIERVINDFGNFEEIIDAYGLKKDQLVFKLSRRFLLVGNILNTIFIILFLDNQFFKGDTYDRTFYFIYN